MSQENRTQSRLLKGNGTNHVPKPPPIARSISKRKRDVKPKKIVSLEEPSPIMIMCFKIEVA
jgi:hypothetical protein